MLTLSNGRTVYTVTTSDSEYTISGTVTILDGSRISDFNGNFKNAEGGNSGSFYYSETTDGKSTRTFNDLPDSDFNFYGYLNSVITDIKASIK